MGAGERPATGLIRYQLGEHAAARRAWAVAAVRAASGLAPLVLAIEFVRHYGGAPPAVFWGLALAVVLLTARAFVQRAATRKRLCAIVFDVDDHAITARSGHETRSIARAEVSRILEIEGALGGIRVEGSSALRSRQRDVVSIPRGGEGFGDVRAKLEGWREVERRGRGAPWMRIVLGTAIVAAMFFLPFALDDLGRRKIVAAAVIILAWMALRNALQSH